MAHIYMTAFVPIAAGLLLAIVVWLVARWSVRGSATGFATGGARTVVVVAGAIPLLVMIGFHLLRYAPVLFGVHVTPEVFQWQWSIRFMLPLILGALGLAILALNSGRRGPRGVAEVARRTPWQFLPRGLTITLAVLVAVAVALALAAGSASEPGPQGLYRKYVVDAGAVGIGTTGFYGWYYSVPALIALAVVIAFVVFHVIRITRASFSPEPAWTEGVAYRRRMIRRVVLVALGGLFAHVSAVFEDLASAAAMSGFSSAGDAGTFFFAAPFAALEPALWVAAWCAFGLGIAAWAGVVLSVLPVLGRKRPAGSESRRRSIKSRTDLP